MGNVVRSATHRKILIPLLVMMAWVAVLAYFGSLTGIWYPSSLKATIVWFVGSALVLLFNINKVWGKSKFFRRKALSLLAPTVLVEYFLNLFVFSFLVELILQPILVVLVAFSSVAGRDPQHRLARKFSDGLLTLAGISAISFTVLEFVRLWDQLETRPLVLDFALPIWLSIALLPFIYMMAAYASYEITFIRIDFLLAESDCRSRRRLKLAVLTTLWGNLRHVVEFGGNWVTQAGSARSFAATREVIQAVLGFQTQGGSKC